MRARLASIAAITALVATASAEPKPTVVDIKPFRDQLIVLQDAQGGTYVVQPGTDGRVFYGVGKTLYEQVVLNRSADGEHQSWSVGLWAPRVPDIAPGTISRSDDGTYVRFCGGDEARLPLTQRTGDAANKILDKSTFMTSAMIRKPRWLARDETLVYYYVDEIRQVYGGKGYRVFVGKKGAMKEVPIVDVATDSAGDVFATKTGDLRLVRVFDDAAKDTATWVHGDKRTTLHLLDVDVNSPLIYRDLGVYGFVGTICENL